MGSNTAFQASASKVESDPRPTGVVIVGCGVVGLAAALSLAACGVSVTVLGPRPSPFVISESQRFDARVFALTHRSRQLLAALRVWDHLTSAQLQAVSAMQIWGDGQGDDQGFVEFQATDSGVDALTWIVGQSDLLEVLLTAVKFQPLITWLDARVDSVSRRSSDWQVRADTGRCVETKRLIVADGADSWTRRQVGLDFALNSYGDEGLVCTFEAEKPHRGVARQWFEADAVLALLPLPGNLVSLVWSQPTAQSVRCVQEGAELLAKKIAHSASGQVAALYGHLKPCGALYAFPLRHGVAPVWVQQGAVLMGDAAHVVHPLAGQGLNLGLEDVAELMSLLQAQKGSFGGACEVIHDEQFWSTWQRRRKAACVPVNWGMSGLHDLFRLNLPGVSLIRNRGMQVVNRLPMLKRWLSRQAMR